MRELAPLYARQDVTVLMACCPADAEQVQLWVDQHLDHRLYRVHPSGVVPQGLTLVTLPWLN